VLLERAGIRTTLLCRTAEQAEELSDARQNERYLPVWSCRATSGSALSAPNLISSAAQISYC